MLLAAVVAMVRLAICGVGALPIEKVCVPEPMIVMLPAAPLANVIAVPFDPFMEMLPAKVEVELYAGLRVAPAPFCTKVTSLLKASPEPPYPPWRRMPVPELTILATPLKVLPPLLELVAEDVCCNVGVPLKTLFWNRILPTVAVKFELAVSPMMYPLALAWLTVMVVAPLNLLPTI